jgi:hypothetical protein
MDVGRPQTLFAFHLPLQRRPVRRVGHPARVLPWDGRSLVAAGAVMYASDRTRMKRRPCVRLAGAMGTM